MDIAPTWQQQARQQAGLIARRQLRAHGIDADVVRNQVAARRWVELSPRVISTTTGPLSWEQRLWLGVLHAGPRSALGSLSAAGARGLLGWERPHVSVYVDDELSFEPVGGIDFFRTRRPFDLLRDPRPGLPTCRVEACLLLFAAYEAPTLRIAHGALAASVQQRLTTAPRLLTWIDQLRPLRRARSLRWALDGIAEGSHSAAELDVPRMCRLFGLPVPARQRPRPDQDGQLRWTDCEWDLPDDTVLVLEVDGAFHRDAGQYDDDLRRHRRLSRPGRIVVRCGAAELHDDPGNVATDLLALGLTGRVPHDAA